MLVFPPYLLCRRHLRTLTPHRAKRVVGIGNTLSSHPSKRVNIHIVQRKENICRQVGLASQTMCWVYLHRHKQAFAGVPTSTPRIAKRNALRQIGKYGGKASWENGLATGEQNKIPSADENTQPSQELQSEIGVSLLRIENCPSPADAILFYLAGARFIFWGRRPIFSGKAMHAKRSLALRKAKGIKPELALRLMALPTNEGNARTLP